MIVLFVQKKPVLSAALQLTFQKQGHRIVFCRDAAKAQQFLDDYLPDIVVTELLLPFVCLDFIAAVKKRHIPLIVLSPLGTDDAVRKAFDYGADDFVQLPFSLKELTMRVNSLATATGKA